jgi:cytochrome c553
MKSSTCVVALARLALAVAATCVSVTEAPAQVTPPGFPAWAYVMNVQPPAPRVPDDGTVFKVPGSEAAFTRDQSRDRYAPPDWHPGDHPPMPKTVAAGRKPVVWACGFCHRPDGAGGPENARISGLPADYIVQQLKDMASGARSTVMPKRLAHTLKQPIVKELTEEEMREAAEYFSRIKPRPVVLVKESVMAPRPVNRGMFLSASEDGAREELGDRIVEVPEDLHRFEVLRDARVRFLAYVPPGSVKKGRDLSRAPGGNAALACAVCHGADLRGQGNIPSIAGRSPTYVVRQLWDMQAGARNGAAAQAMQPVLASMSGQDMLALAAWLATLEP